MSAQLKVRLDVADPPAILCAAAQLTGPSGSDLLPILVKAMRSPDPAIQVASLRSFAMIQNSRAALHRPIATSPDIKLMEYAKKIVTRYDGDGDGALTISERQTMLVDPSSADLDSDGKINVDEYAAWMAQKSQR